MPDAGNWRWCLGEQLVDEQLAEYGIHHRNAPQHKRLISSNRAGFGLSGIGFVTWYSSLLKLKLKVYRKSRLFQLKSIADLRRIEFLVSKQSGLR